MNVEFVDQRYNGVKGWLRFLVLILIVLRPLFGLARISKLLTIYPSASMYGGLSRLLIIDIVVGAVLILYSIYAGIRLSMISADAVWTAKSYFVMEFIAAVFMSILYLQAALPDAAQAALNRTVVDVVKTAVACGIWFLYLSNSKRVQVTYS